MMAENISQESWGSRFIQLRKERGLSPAEVARQARISPSLISKIEQGLSKVPQDKTIRRLAAGFNMSETQFRQRIFGENPPSRMDTPDELLARVEASLPLSVPVYEHYPYVPGERSVALIYAPKTEGISRHVKGYVVHGDDLEPEFKRGEYIAYSPERIAQNGDKIIYLSNGNVKVGTLKVVGSTNYIESKDGSIRYEDCVSCAVIIGSYRNFVKS